MSLKHAEALRLRGSARRWAAAFVLAVAAAAGGPPAVAEIDRAELQKTCSGADADRAIVACTTLLEHYKPQANTYDFRGLAYLGKRDYLNAFEDFRSSATIEPDWAIPYYRAGFVLFAERKYDAAVQYFDRSQQKDAKFVDALYMRGLSYLELARQRSAIGDFGSVEPLLERAREDFKSCITTNPGDARNYIGRGDVYAEEARGQTISSDLDSAIKDYRTALSVDPNNYQAHVHLGNAFLDYEDPERAISEYDFAIKINPDVAAAYNNRGIAFSRKREFFRAIADYDRAIEIDNTNAGALSNRGRAYGALGDHGRAMADFGRSIGLNANYALAWLNRGAERWQDGAGDAEAAISDIEHGLTIEPGNAYFRTKLEEIRNRRSAIGARNQAVIPGRRVALVIGNSDYAQINKLPNAAKDAEAVVKELRARGYEVVDLYDLKTAALKTAIDTFREKTAPRSEVALVWYVGHGQSVQVQDGGRAEIAAVSRDNFILGTDYASGGDVGHTGVTVGELINAALPAKTLHVVVIDACRGGVGKGIAGVDRGSYVGTDKPKPAAEGITPNDDNLYVVYSTAPGKNASDGPPNAHSPFTQAFLNETAAGRIQNDVRQFFSGVKTATAAATDRNQEAQLYEAQMSGDAMPLVRLGNGEAH